MTINKRAIVAVLALATLLLQFSCDNSYGIFDHIQMETAQKGNDLFKTRSVTKIVTDGSSYYATTARLYKRAVAYGSEWSKVAIAGYSDYEIYGLAAIGANVYASISADGARGVYNVGTGAALGGVPSSSEALFEANGNLYLSRHEEDTTQDPSTSTYSLFYYNGTNFQQIAPFGSPTVTIRGVAWDGTYYYFAAADRLYRGLNPNGSDAAQVAFSETIRSISSRDSSGADSAYIGTTNGVAYRYQNGTALSRSGFTTIPITTVVEVPLTPTTWKVLVGTGTSSMSDDSQGYFEAETDNFATTAFMSGEDGPVTLNSSIYSTTIVDMAVNAFLYDGSTNTLLIGIASYSSSGTRFGLYSTVWSGSSWSGWKAE